MKPTSCHLSIARRPKVPMCRLALAAACALMAASAWADSEIIGDGAPLKVLVPTDGSLGGTWRGRGFDDSSWPSGNNGVGYEVQPGAYNASVIADSQGEWSSSGQQGQNSWINGYYDKTADTDGAYQATDFQPFPRSDGPYGADNFWEGGQWNWFNGDPPWDEIGTATLHPNGINNAVEHWVIRRWVSTASGAITVRFHVRKTNPGGAGVTGKVIKNGTELFSRAINGPDTIGYEVYVNTTAAKGDAFDFALTPIGPNGDESDGADGSALTATVLSGTVTPPPPPVVAMGVADSVADWSPTGTQGANNWYYGYYNRTADVDGSYNPSTDFNMTDPNWTFAGDWVLGVTGDPGANPPWDTIGQTSWHPNGDNQPQGIHWVIRRWVCEVDGDIYAQIKFAKANTSGNGTTLHVLHNGAEVYTQTLNNTAGINVPVAFPGVLIGDKIEFALDPRGTDGLFGDGSDSSTFSAAIFTGPAPPTATTYADSSADWSATGVQGFRNWSYGFYNETADPDHIYTAAEFNRTDPDWTFLGGAWQLGVPGNAGANPPWDTIGQTEWHPNGDNQPQGIHWVIRRWVSTVDGDIQAHIRFGKQNVGGGNGTTLRVLKNGTPVLSRTVAFNDGTGIDTFVGFPDTFMGDIIDFALDPLGTDGGKGDGADGSYLTATIHPGLPPEPPKPFVAGVADCFVTNIEAAMRGHNPSAFVRIPFDVANPAAIETLKLKMKYTDGFVAYLNGTEIARRNAPTSIAGITVADSVADWSFNPDVTVNGWSYGYYNQTLDADRVYSGGADYTPFPHDGLGYSATDFWDGGGYNWFAGDPPWTELYQRATHPNHPNDEPEATRNLHWTIRRWNATVDANLLKCRIQFRKINANCGDGVRVSLFHNSVQVYSQTIAFNDAVGRDDTVELPDVFLGDTIDLLLGPGDSNDFCDGSEFSAVIFEGEPSIPWNGAATASRTTAQTISPEVFDLTAFKSELLPTGNVLAIQGFNASANDNEFVINAQLLANRVPVANGDTVAAVDGVPAIFPAPSLLANDSDPDGDTLLLVGVTPSYVTSQGGAVRLYGDTVHYTSALGFTGADSFQYTVTDLSGVPVRATVNVTVDPFPVNHAPSFTLAGASVSENTTNPRIVPGWALNISPGSAPYEAGQAVSFIVANDSPSLFSSQPAINPAGTLSFRALQGASSIVSVTVRARDDGGTDRGGVDTSAPQTFSIGLEVPCSAALAQSVTVNSGNSIPITLTAANAEGGTFAISAPPAHGTLSGTPPSVVYTPSAGYIGPDSFRFTVAASGCPISEATVSITVLNANECPVARAAVTPPVWSSTDDYVFSVTLNGASERPNPVATGGTGTGTLTLSGNVLTLDLEYSGLSAPAVAGHIHGPATTEQAAGVILNLIGTFGPAGSTAGTLAGSTVISDSLAGRLIAGLTYINIHTGNYPGGEIRGQVVLVHGPTVTILSPDSVGAQVGLDGTASSDADGDALTFSWVELIQGSPPTPLGSGATISTILAVGSHQIELQVSDGVCVDTDSLAVNVITAGQAVEDLIMLVNGSDVESKNKRPFIASLKAAEASFDRGNLTSAINQLQAFQHKTRAQIGTTHPDVAEEWIRIAQIIIDTVGGN